MFLEPSNFKMAGNSESQFFTKLILYSFIGIVGWSPPKRSVFRTVQDFVAEITPTQKWKSTRICQMYWTTKNFRQLAVSLYPHFFENFFSFRSLFHSQFSMNRIKKCVRDSDVIIAFAYCALKTRTQFLLNWPMRLQMSEQIAHAIECGLLAIVAFIP